MPTENSSESFDFFPCLFFSIGKVKINKNIRSKLTDGEIIAALKRHANRDFGNVSWEHHHENLISITEASEGVVESIYPASNGAVLHITTMLDDFNPRTTIMMV